MSGALRVKGRHARSVAGPPAAGEPAPPDPADAEPPPGETGRRARRAAGRRAGRAAAVRVVGTVTGRRARAAAAARETETAPAARETEATSAVREVEATSAVREVEAASAVREAGATAGFAQVEVASAMRRVTAALAGAGARSRSSSRRTKATLASAVCLAVGLTASVAAFLTLVPAQSAPKATAVNVLAARPAPAPAALAPSRSSRAARRGDQAALTFYEQHDPARAAHVTEVIWTGPMLRVYTDLPASDADSKTAIALCETAEAYARDRGRLPAVFVHADRQAGYPVLANKMGAHDDCKLGRVP
ncbi:MAG: hypothetical protein ACRDP6_45895 [Actinoallomurus sp.]